MLVIYKNTYVVVANLQTSKFRLLNLSLLQPRVHCAMLKTSEDGISSRSETLRASPIDTRFSQEDIDVTTRIAKVYVDG